MCTDYVQNISTVFTESRNSGAYLWYPFCTVIFKPVKRINNERFVL